MKKAELYNDYLSKLETALETDNFEWIDYILEFLNTGWLQEKDLEEVDDILHEATLYSELKKLDYKETAIDLISEYK